MSTIYLIRHGDKSPTPPDPGLNDLGQEQARKTAAHLKQFPIQKIIASPLRRALETAQPIAAALGLEIATDNRLRERLNWGDDPTQSRKDFIDLWCQTTRDRNFEPPFGLSSRAAGENLSELIAELSNEKASQIALITHGGVIADFLRNNFPEAELAKITVEYPDGKDYGVWECSITELDLGDQIGITRLNDISYLDMV